MQSIHSRQNISAVLSKYIPLPTVEICAEWIIQKNIHLKITRGRSTKFGDYLPLPHGQGHRITVNHDLNPYSFLITFVHEVAHLHTFNKYKRRHEPHGKEWKNEFSILLKDFIRQNIFPDDIRSALITYTENPSASSCTDLNLFRALKRYDGNRGLLHLEDLPENSIFKLNNSRPNLLFKKGHKIRSRYHCVEMKTDKVYFVSPLAEVTLKPCS
jgi:hypothetical protein